MKAKNLTRAIKIIQKMYQAFPRARNSLIRLGKNKNINVKHTNTNKNCTKIHLATYFYNIIRTIIIKISACKAINKMFMNKLFLVCVRLWNTQEVTFFFACVFITNQSYKHETVTNIFVF